MTSWLRTWQAKGLGFIFMAFIIVFFGNYSTTSFLAGLMFGTGLIMFMGKK
jgi:hypothetical protein